MGFSDEFVIGHIGRMSEQKNQQFLFDIFNEIVKEKPDARFLLIGKGELEDKIRNKVEKLNLKKLNLNDKIIFFGTTTEIPGILAAMDVFVFPSRFEGLPVVLLEAQITGLPCIVSDKVTKEVDFGEIQWLSIDGNPESWAKAVSQTIVRSNAQRRDYRGEHIAQIERYDINQTVKQLDVIYERLVQR